MGFRYYNPITGRYISRDPAGYPNGLNCYLYVNNNPINRIDPLGLWILPLLAVIAEAAEPFVVPAVQAIGTSAVVVAAGAFVHDVLNGNISLPGIPAGGTVPNSGVANVGGTPMYPAPSQQAMNEAKEREVPAAPETPPKTAAPTENPSAAPVNPSAAAAGDKQPGSYTNTHASGKTYSGKGTKARSQASGKRVEKENNDPHVGTDWKPSANNKESFKDEAQRIRDNDGVKSPDNYNKINSPGEKYLPPPTPPPTPPPAPPQTAP